MRSSLIFVALIFVLAAVADTVSVARFTEGPSVRPVDPEAELVGWELKEVVPQRMDGNGNPMKHLYLIFRVASNEMLLTDPPRPVPDRVYKLPVTGPFNQGVYVGEPIEGKHLPAYTVKEQFLFDDAGE
jgi:hypothetical protein